MEIGVTVGDSIERIDRTGREFSFVEFGLGETAEISNDIDQCALQSTLESCDVALDVHLPFKQVAATPVPEINAAIVKYLDRLLGWSGRMNARKAVLHGTVRNPHDPSQRKFVADQLREITAAGAKHGVEVVVENVGHQQFGLQLTVLGDIARDTDTPICFDVGHAYMEDGHKGIERFIKRYQDLISHLHVHDVRSRGDTHMPLGAGEIEYERISEFLSEFPGTIAIEVFSDDVPLLIDTSERIQRLPTSVQG